MGNRGENVHHMTCYRHKEIMLGEKKAYEKALSKKENGKSGIL